MRCRHCSSSQLTAVLDLGFAPPSNAYLKSDDLQTHEKHYPLRLSVCEQCRLVQTEDFNNREQLFTSEYAYFSSTSRGWLEHSARYVEAITRRLGLGRDSLAIEVACNDGYLLKNFVAAGIPCLGIEPTASTAAAAEKLGIPVRREFFGEQFAGTLAAEGKSADLIIGNNVFAHVPDINDFTRGLKAALRPGGTITLEFPHLLRLIEHTQFDTVYHEHFSYLSLHTVSRIFAAAGLRVFDIEELSTHGGSLRVYGAHANDARETSPAVTAVLSDEIRNGLESSEPYRTLQSRSERIKDDLLAFLIDAKRAGKKVAAYGAAAKGNTLLNYAGVRPDLLQFVCDAAPAKQGKFMPGSHIPILAPQTLRERKPDIILVLPWNIAAEVVAQNSFARDWGARFFAAIPSMREIT